MGGPRRALPTWSCPSLQRAACTRPQPRISRPATLLFTEALGLSPRSAPPSTTPSGSEVRAGLGAEGCSWGDGASGRRWQGAGRWWWQCADTQRSWAVWGQEFLSGCRSSSVPFPVTSPAEPHFVHALEHGDHVYFFFREVSVEDARLGRVRRWAPRVSSLGVGRGVLLDPGPNTLPCTLSPQCGAAPTPFCAPRP